MKIYKNGNFLAIDKEDGSKIEYLPSQHTDFNNSGGGSYYILNSLQPTEKYNFHFSDLKDGNGNLIGIESDVLNYLSTVSNGVQAETLTLLSHIASNTGDSVLNNTVWNKFGYNRDIDIGTEVIASWGGTFEPLTNATTLTISSLSANDTNGGTGCNTIVIYGIDSNRNEAIEVVNMDGINDVITASTWLGINRVAMYLCGSGKINEGTINVLATSDSSIMAQMPANEGVTQQCIFHIPADNVFAAKWLFINVLNRGKNAELTVKMWVYSAISNGNQNVFAIDIDTSTSTGVIDLNPSLSFPISEKSVVWLECTTDTNDIIVNARFSGDLISTI